MGETSANKEVAKELVEKWSRGVFDKTMDFSKLSEYEGERQQYKAQQRYDAQKARATKGVLGTGVQSKPRFGGAQQRANEKYAQLRGKPREMDRVQMPQPINVDFSVRPQTKLDMASRKSRKLDPQSNKGKLVKKMENIARPVQKAKRAVKMSIE